MKKFKGKLLLVFAILVIGGIYYYINLPALNFHASGFWGFIIAVVAIVMALYAIWKLRGNAPGNLNDILTLKDTKPMKIGLAVILLLVGVYLIGSLLSSPIINAKKYQKLVEPETSDFTTDIQQISYSQIPLLDKDSAALLGNRKMGTLVNMVSQFEVSDLYSQINYKSQPVRVSPLVYASAIKWFTNQKEGIPGYISIDMATQETELVTVDGGIKYSQSEYLNRNIYRHLRFRYPTYIFDQLSFEINDEGVPYWICPVKKYTIGLFGGQTIGRVILCNAITGECENYVVEDCPQWVDRVYPAELLVNLYNYHGTLINGFFNSVLGQKGCLKTTDGYNYLAIDDDVWVYTGVTSVSGDKSNVGFVLMNQRTKETKYYEISGAEEYSAMESAEGQVQNLGYVATFPLLLNISNEPTYFIALKDNAGLVKKYAMVNIQKYQNVAIGDTVAACEKTYRKLIAAGGGSLDNTDENDKITGKIKRISQAVVDGNTHFYIILEESDLIFDIPITEFMEILKYEVGEEITFTYAPGDPVCTVLSMAGSKTTNEVVAGENTPVTEEDDSVDLDNASESK